MAVVRTAGSSKARRTTSASTTAESDEEDSTEDEGTVSSLAPGNGPESDVAEQLQESEGIADEEEIPLSKADISRALRPQQRGVPRQSVVAVAPVYNEWDDFEVDHSGTVDLETGRPRYDEAPVAGGNIAKRVRLPNNRTVLVNINAGGQQIDPNSGDEQNRATLVNPERDAIEPNELG